MTTQGTDLQTPHLPAARKKHKTRDETGHTDIICSKIVVSIHLIALCAQTQQRRSAVYSRHDIAIDSLLN